MKKTVSIILITIMFASFITPCSSGLVFAENANIDSVVDTETAADSNESNLTETDETAVLQKPADEINEESGGRLQMATLAADSEGELKPYFDFDAYDWSDPTEYLNQYAKDRYPYWNANATAGDNLFPNWNGKYWDRASDPSNPYIGDFDVPDTLCKNVIKQRVDEGVFPTDEKFFGVWNEAAQSWTIKPMIDYDFVSQYDFMLTDRLINVGEAAKHGDYEAAKKAYLAYQRNLLKVNPLAVPAITNDAKVRSDMLTRNLYIHSSFPATAWFFMNQQESSISVDVTTAVESKRNGKGTIVLVAPDKDEYQAEFYSKEALGGQYAPYIEAYVGGGKVTFPVIADAYVGGGLANEKTKFGATDPNRLLVSESENKTAGQTANDGYLIGENMRRTYLHFDFKSKIKPGDIISSATLKLRGKVNDIAEVKRNDPSYKKLIAVTGLSSDTFDENEIVFGDTGGAYVNGVYSEQSTSDKMQSFFWGKLAQTSQYPNSRMEEDPFRFSGWWDIISQQYYATGNENYARTAMLLLHDFIKVTYCLAMNESGTHSQWFNSMTKMNIKGGHHLFGAYASTLDTSQRSSSVPVNLKYLIGSEYMTPELFTAFAKYMKMMGNKAVRDTWSNSEHGNWGSMQIDGHSRIIFQYPELECKDPDIPGQPPVNWINAINKHSNITFDVKSDGSGGELSQAYMHVAINRLLNIKRGADAIQYKFDFSDRTLLRIKQIAEFLARTCLPGVKEAQYGDGNGITNSYKYQAVQYVADWLKDPELLWIVYDGKKGKMPDYTSYYYPVGKFFAMRNNWSDDAMFLHINSDKAEGAHSHWDDGAVIVAAYGNYLLADNGYLGYLPSNLPHRWQISSRGHNAVEINDYCQTSYSPNTMDYTLVSQAVYNNASYPNGTAKLPDPNSKGIYERIVTGKNYDFSRLDVSNVYKDLGYHADPLMAPSTTSPTASPSDQQAPPREPGMTFKRNILFLKDAFWIVSDYMKPVNNYNKNKGETQPNKFSQYWHMTPESNMYIDGQYKLNPGETVKRTHSNFADVDKQIENTQFVPGTGTGAFKSDFNGKANIQVVPADLTNTVPRLCYGYYTDGMSTPYGRYDKTVFGATKMDAILFPSKTGDVYSVVPTPVAVSGVKDSYVNIDNLGEVKEDGAVSAFTADIKMEAGAEKEDYNINFMLLHESDKRTSEELGFSDYTTNGDLAYYELNNDETGTPRRLILQNGTHFKRSTSMNYEVAYSRAANKIDSVSVKWSGTKLEIDAGETRKDNGDMLNPAFDVAAFLADFTVFAPYKIDGVTVNGKSVAFKQQNNYVYFGDSPIINGGEIPNPPPAQKPESGKNNPHGAGGSGASIAPTPPTTVPTPPTTTPGRTSDAFNSELKGHWGETEIRELIDNGVVKGNGNTLNLSGEVSRAEFVTLILRAFGIEPKTYNGSFSDVSGDEWYADYIQAAYDLKILEGAEGKALPEYILTREQAVKIMLKALEAKRSVSYVDDSLTFNDSVNISSWAEIFVVTAVKMGLVKGMEGNAFKPQNYTLREQSMIMVYRLLKELQ